MAEQVATRQTSLGAEDAVVRAVEFFANERWRPQTQSARAATFVGRPPIPWGLILLMIVLLIPTVGIGSLIVYILIVRRVIRFQNLVVTASAATKGSQVTVRYPGHAKKLVNRYLDALAEP